jgi:hypothetical protein
MKNDDLPNAVFAVVVMILMACGVLLVMAGVVAAWREALS